MKRLLLAVFLILISSTVTGSVYSWLRSPASEERCTMDWLSRALALQPEQYEKVWAVHVRRCAEIKVLGGSPAEPACVELTALLIEEVSALLTPQQAEKYRQLLDSCRGQKCAAP